MKDSIYCQNCGNPIINEENQKCDLCGSLITQFGCIYKYEVDDLKKAGLIVIITLAIIVIILTIFLLIINSIPIISIIYEA